MVNDKKDMDKKVDNKKSKDDKAKISDVDMIKQLKAENLTLRDMNLREKAEFQNYRKRNELERIKTKENSIINFVEDLIPVIDNFELSLKMTDNNEMFIKGVEMLHQNMIKILEERKIKTFMPKVGEKFNPKEHDPILIEDDKAKEGHILAIIKKGYKINDRIIVPSKVNVKKG